MQMASLDHAMWFHRPFRADEWLLYDQHALSTGSARGLAGGAIFTDRRHARRQRGPRGPGEGGPVTARRRGPPVAVAVGVVAGDGVLRRRRRRRRRRPSGATHVRRRRPTDAHRRIGAGEPRRRRRPTTTAGDDARRDDRPPRDHDDHRRRPAPTPRPSRSPRSARSTARSTWSWRAGDDALFVVEQDGHDRPSSATTAPTTVLDISDPVSGGSEQGLLGLAFDASGGARLRQLHRRRRQHDRRGARRRRRRHVRRDRGPRGCSRSTSRTPTTTAATSSSGPTGCLYIGMGDGGSGGDPERRATNLGELLGKLLRIDPTPDGAEPYTIPPDNPFVGVAGARPEIWSTGLRNPWRFSFDRGHRRPVDRRRRPERDRGDRRRAGHRRSRRRQGPELRLERVRGRRTATTTTCRPTAPPPPFTTYAPRRRGCSISGGVRARGAQVPDLSAGTCTATTAPARCGPSRCSATGRR